MTTTTSTETTTPRKRSLPAAPSLGLLVLRLAFGAIFIAHGAQKVFVFGFVGVGGSFAEMGVPMAEIVGPIVGLLELVGGILLVLGLGTRIVGLLLAINMIVATILVHLPAGIFASEGGYELTLALAAAALALALTGAGKFSIDAIISHRRRAVSAR
jgi:putative oxidoreductase